MSGVWSQPKIDFPFHGINPHFRGPVLKYVKSFRFSRKLDSSSENFAGNEKIFLRSSISCISKDFSGKLDIIFQNLSDQIAINIIYNSGIENIK